MDEPRITLDPSATRVDPEAFVADSARLIGDVRVGPGASLWYGVVARGDVEAIRVGKDSNVQDLTVLHADPGHPCVLGEGVTVGHRCIVHGATVEDHCLVGMGAILMNGVVIGRESLVGAGALVPEGREFPPRSLILGAPATMKRPLTEDEVRALHESARRYVANGRAHKAAGFHRDP